MKFVICTRNVGPGRYAATVRDWRGTEHEFVGATDAQAQRAALRALRQAQQRSANPTEHEIDFQYAGGSVR